MITEYNQKKLNYLFIFHILLGLISNFTKIPIYIWFFYNLFIFFYVTIKHQKTNIIEIYYLLYLVSFEVFCRMLGTSPLIPYELGKYLCLVYLVFCIMKNNITKKSEGWFMLLFLIPGCLIINESVLNHSYRTYVFNVFGSFVTALSIIFFQNVKVKVDDLSKIFHFILLPIIPSLVFSIVNMPKLNEINIILGSNFDFTAGFGPNQVITQFGLAIFILFIFLIKNIIIINSFFHYILLFLFIAQGFLSFSRGGMIVAFISILVMLYFYINDNNKNQLKYSRAYKIIFLTLGIFFTTFFIINNFSDGAILHRYKGDTIGTILGKKEKTLNHITTHRYQVFKDDYKLFKEKLFFGNGVGSSTYLRENTYGILSHVEISRLLSEHGIFGFIYILLLIKCFFNTYGLNSKNRGILIGLYIIGFLTMMHSSTRIVTGSILIGLSQILIVDNDTA